MSKRYASHYLLLPGCGYIRQQVVEFSSKGRVARIFPMEEESEAVEWHPGVIALLPEWPEEVSREEEANQLFTLPCLQGEAALTGVARWLQEAAIAGCLFIPYLFYPFDFTSGRPADGTRRRPLPWR
jgi:hypothetical protein